MGAIFGGIKLHAMLPVFGGLISKEQLLQSFVEFPHKGFQVKRGTPIFPNFLFKIF